MTVTWLTLPGGRLVTTLSTEATRSAPAVLMETTWSMPSARAIVHSSASGGPRALAAVSPAVAAARVALLTFRSAGLTGGGGGGVTGTGAVRATCAAGSWTGAATTGAGAGAAAATTAGAELETTAAAGAGSAETVALEI